MSNENLYKFKNPTWLTRLLGLGIGLLIALQGVQIPTRDERVARGLLERHAHPLACLHHQLTDRLHLALRPKQEVGEHVGIGRRLVVKAHVRDRLVDADVGEVEHPLLQIEGETDDTANQVARRDR